MKLKPSRIMKDYPVKLGYRPRDAIAAIGSKKLYLECVRRGWLKPVVRQHKLTLFEWRDIEKCFERIAAGELSQPEHEESKQ
jgi:hypothetical protein